MQRPAPFGRAAWAILAAYGVLAAAIVLITGADSFAAANRYGTAAALALLQHGAFVNPIEPTQPYTSWPPGFPLFMVPFLVLEGAGHVYSMLAVFVAMHVAIGLVVRRIVDGALPGYGDVAFALVLFNPNLIAMAFHNDADHLYAFLATISFAALFAYLRRPRLSAALAAGLFLGAATLVRPVTQFLIPLLPVAVPLLLLAQRELGWRRDLAAGVVAAVAAAAVVMPWAVHMVRAGEGLTIAGSGSQALFFEENIAMIETENGVVAPDVTYHDVRSRVIAEREGALEAAVAGWEELSIVEKSRLRKAFMVEYTLSRDYGWSIWARATARSWVRTLVSGGEGDLMLLFGIEADEGNGVFAPVLKILATGFSIALRILGLLGIVELVRRREYGVLLLLVGVAAYFSAAHLALGRPRFRAAIEAPLLLLALYGLTWVRARGVRARGMRARETGIAAAS